MGTSAISKVFLGGIIAAFLISGQTAFADPNLVSWWKLNDASDMWSDYGDNYIIDGQWGSVWKDGVTYHYFYTYSEGVGHATSTDRLVWTIDDGNTPVMTGGNVPVVWKESGTWYMLFRDKDGISLATSPDAVTWTPYAGNPVIPEGTGADWDNCGWLDVWGIIKVDSTYYCWYSTVGLVSIRQCGLATSSDLTTWTKDANNPIFDGTDPYYHTIHPFIFKYGSYYYLTVMHKLVTGSWETLLFRDSSPTFYSADRKLVRRITKDDNVGWNASNNTVDSILTNDVNRDSFPNGEILAYIVARDAESNSRIGLLIESDPAAVLAMDTNSVAESISGQNGTARCPVSSLSETGRIDGGFLFDGVNDYIDVSVIDADFDISSIVFWIKLVDDWGDRTEYMIGMYLNTNNRFYLKATATDMYFYCKNNGNVFSDYKYSMSDTALENDEWNMFTIVSTGSDLCKLYINATEVTVGTGFDQDLVAMGGGQLLIGRYYTSTPIKGTIDDVRIYDRTLSAEEIEQLYWEGLGGRAFNPNPIDGAQDVNRNVVLSWSPGKDANSHDVYFGTDYNGVNDADIYSPEYMGNFDVNSFDPCGLNLLTTYYWRIDEVNDPNIWKGVVWSFTTISSLVIENFDSYENDTALRSVWDNNSSSAEVSVETAIFVDGNSMKYRYDNNLPPYYSEAYADINAFPSGIGSDWLGMGAEALVLWFYGKSDNPTTEQMYVKLDDTDSNATVTYGDNPDEEQNDLKVPEWHRWNIDLEDFNSAGVDLTNIKRLTIGFGDNIGQGNCGELYFDDISVCGRKICRTCLGDWNSDGWVKINDLTALGNALDKAPAYRIPATDCEYKPCCDIDGNGWLRINDYSALSNYINTLAAYRCRCDLCPPW